MPADLPAIRARLATIGTTDTGSVAMRRQYREDVGALLPIAEAAAAYVDRRSDLSSARCRAQVCGDYEPIGPAEIAARDAWNALCRALAAAQGGDRG
jgi:hypothetical protein